MVVRSVSWQSHNESFCIYGLTPSFHHLPSKVESLLHISATVINVKIWDQAGEFISQGFYKCNKPVHQTRMPDYTVTFIRDAIFIGFL